MPMSVRAATTFVVSALPLNTDFARWICALALQDHQKPAGLDLGLAFCLGSRIPLTG